MYKMITGTYTIPDKAYTGTFDSIFELTVSLRIPLYQNDYRTKHQYAVLTQSIGPNWSGQKYRPRLDATERSMCSGSTLIATHQFMQQMIN